MADTCLFFDKLPAEIRDEIYELAFTPDTADDKFDLTNPRPPSKAMIMTCRQAYEEACQLYKIAYRRYWKDGSFCIDYSRVKLEESQQASQLVPTAISDPLALNHISRLAIEWSEDKETTHGAFEMADRRGLWKMTVLKLGAKQVHWIRVSELKISCGGHNFTSITFVGEGGEAALKGQRVASLPQQLGCLLNFLKDGCWADQRTYVS